MFDWPIDTSRNWLTNSLTGCSTVHQILAVQEHRKRMRTKLSEVRHNRAALMLLLFPNGSPDSRVTRARTHIYIYSYMKLSLWFLFSLSHTHTHTHTSSTALSRLPSLTPSFPSPRVGRLFKTSIPPRYTQQLSSVLRYIFFSCNSRPLGTSGFHIAISTGLWGPSSYSRLNRIAILRPATIDFSTVECSIR